MNNDKLIMNLPEIYSALRKGKIIQNVNVTEIIDLENVFPEKSRLKEWTYDLPVTFRNCDIKGIYVPPREYAKNFCIENCMIESADLDGCYLIEGITISTCTFKSDMRLLSAGGHNKPGVPVIIKDTTFLGRVDFVDAWFMRPVKITGCNFMAGTNLLGNVGCSYSVTFDVNPDIHDNKGKMNLDGHTAEWNVISSPNPLPVIQIKQSAANGYIKIKKTRKRFLWF